MTTGATKLRLLGSKCERTVMSSDPLPRRVKTQNSSRTLNLGISITVQFRDVSGVAMGDMGELYKVRQKGDAPSFF